MWANEQHLVVAGFFFWFGGSELQKSQIGLLRGLLYQCLKDHRELLLVIIPETSSTRTEDLKEFWTLNRFKKAFNCLVTQNTISLKICLFIDGLDEYVGDHLELINLMKRVENHSNIKLCISSRPLSVFEKAFWICANLTLQHLAFDDIENYVNDQLLESKGMMVLEEEDPGITEKLAREIVTKALAVFLWVRLLVTSLIEGLGNFDTRLDLARRLEKLPEELEDLYWHMIDRVKPQWYLEQGFRLLFLVKAANGTMSLLQLCFAEMKFDDKMEGEQAILLESPSLEKQRTARITMAGRIRGRCLR
jgi:hypothetical protein